MRSSPFTSVIIQSLFRLSTGMNWDSSPASSSKPAVVLVVPLGLVTPSTPKKMLVALVEGALKITPEQGTSGSRAAVVPPFTSPVNIVLNTCSLIV